MATPSQERLKEDPKLDKKGLLNLTVKLSIWLCLFPILTRTVGERERGEEQWKEHNRARCKEPSGRSCGKRKRLRGSSSRDCQQRKIPVEWMWRRTLLHCKCLKATPVWVTSQTRLKMLGFFVFKFASNSVFLFIWNEKFHILKILFSLRPDIFLNYTQSFTYLIERSILVLHNSPTQGQKLILNCTELSILQNVKNSPKHFFELLASVDGEGNKERGLWESGCIEWRVASPCWGFLLIRSGSTALLVGRGHSSFLFVCTVHLY